MPFDETPITPHGGGDGSHDPRHDPAKIVLLVNAVLLTVKEQLKEQDVCRTCAITNVVFNLAGKLAELYEGDEDSILDKLFNAVELGVGVAIAKRMAQNGELN